METPPQTPTRWTVDSDHSNVGFSVRHLLISNARGTFERLEGTVVYDASNPAASHAEIIIHAASIHTRQQVRDTHLRSPDFFDVEKHPVIVFRSTRAGIDQGVLQSLTGDLSIRGITREVTLTLDELTGPQKDLTGKVRMAASAHTTIRRSDFGITFNRPLETGGFALADEVALTLDVSLIKQD